MKILCYITLLFLPVTKILSQSADELWTSLQARYHQLNNYVDSGTSTRISMGNISVISVNTYTLAIDRQKNVNHFIGEKNNPDMYYIYRKSAEQDSGQFIRGFQKNKIDHYALEAACASLWAVGDGILNLTANLMFPDLYEPQERGPMFHFDSLGTEPDTLMGGDLYKILDVYSSYFRSKEMIEANQHYYDSVNFLTTLPVGQRGSIIQNKETGMVNFLYRYFIRQADGLIHRREIYVTDTGKLSSKSITEMNPRADVAQFEHYLKSSEFPNRE